MIPYAENYEAATTCCADFKEILPVPVFGFPKVLQSMNELEY